MAKKTLGNKTKNSKLLEILENSYVGEIVDIDDPDYVGRCKVLVFGVFDGKNLGKIPKDDLPWAYPYNDIVFGSKSGSGKFSSPKMGAIVRVVFHGDQYHPRYYSLEELDQEMKDLIKLNYSNFHSILFDSEEKLKMYYTKKSGFMLDLKESIINIGNDGAILIRHKGNSSQMEMRGPDIDIVTNNSVNISSQNSVTINSQLVHANGVQTDLGANPIYSNVNGEILMQLIKILATGLDAKYPSTPGSFTGIVAQMESLILSQTVKTTP